MELKLNKVSTRLVQVCLPLFSETPEKSSSYFSLDTEIKGKQWLLRSLFFGVIIACLGVILQIPLIILSGPTMSIVLFILQVGQYPVKYQQIQNTVLEYSDLLYNELATVKIFSNSIIDAIRFLANGNYPYISKELTHILQKITLGFPPEQQIFNFLERYPNQALIAGFSMFLDKQEADQTIVDVTHRLTQQIAVGQYEEMTNQLESRIMIFVGLALFLIPIYQILAALDNWSLYTLWGAPIFLGVVVLLDQLLFRKLQLGRISTK